MNYKEREEAEAIIRSYDGVSVETMMRRVYRICGGFPSEMNRRRCRGMHPAVKAKCVTMLEVCIGRLAERGGPDDMLDTCWSYIEKLEAMNCNTSGAR